MQQRSQAKLLTDKGNQQLRLGLPVEALDSFKEATKIYQQMKYNEGITGSLINQSLALQALGLNSRACKTLLPALNINADDWICNSSLESSEELTEKLVAKIIKQETGSSVTLLGLLNLGNVLRQLGKLKESEIILQKALLLAKQTSSAQVSTILLSLGDTKRYIYKQFKDRFAVIEEPISQQQTFNVVQENATEAIQLYQQVIEDSNSSFENKASSQANLLNLLVTYDKWLKKWLSQSNYGKII
ncbi:tetratricopeptide repeat protein [Nostoc sp. FACHB-152]|nr:tetratricopeptide repeat protein [Nostoc sp. FACHB-152]